MSGPYRDEWIAAIMEELASLERMGVYEDATLPLGRKLVKSKWVLRVKRDEHGNIIRFKARLVAKGYSQIYGVDFDETFAPVAKWDSIRLILALTAINDWELHHYDIKTAYLHGVLDEEVYIEKPKEFVGAGVWRLLKALYGLKQIPSM